MRSVFALLVACSCVGSVLLAADDDDEVKVVSKKGGVSAVFPAKPALKEEKGSEQYLLELKGKGALMLNYTAFPKKVDLEDEAVVKKLLDANQEGMVKAFEGAKLVSAKDVKDADNPTRDVEIDLGAAGHYRARYVLGEEGLCQAVAMGAKEFVLDKGTSKFLKSIELED